MNVIRPGVRSGFAALSGALETGRCATPDSDFSSLQPVRHLTQCTGRSKDQSARKIDFPAVNLSTATSQPKETLSLPLRHGPWRPACKLTSTSPPAKAGSWSTRSGSPARPSAWIWHSPEPRPHDSVGLEFAVRQQAAGEPSIIGRFGLAVDERREEHGKSGSLRNHVASNPLTSPQYRCIQRFLAPSSSRGPISCKCKLFSLYVSKCCSKFAGKHARQPYQENNT